MRDAYGVGLNFGSFSGGEGKDSSLDAITSSGVPTDEERLVTSEETEITDRKAYLRLMLTKATNVLAKAKTGCLLALGLGEDTINASSVLVMPMVSSKITGFRGNAADRAKYLPMRNSGWSKIPMDEDSAKLIETSSTVSQSV